MRVVTLRPASEDADGITRYTVWSNPHLQTVYIHALHLWIGVDYDVVVDATGVVYHQMEDGTVQEVFTDSRDRYSNPSGIITDRKYFTKPLILGIGKVLSFGRVASHWISYPQHPKHQQRLQIDYSLEP